MSAVRDRAHNPGSNALLQSSFSDIRRPLPVAVCDGAELNDELKKFGLRLRPRRVGVPAGEKPGKVAFDERGNAIYQWHDDRLAEDSETGERLRRQALGHPTLSLAEEETPADVPIRANPKGLRVGYNPYESGLLTKKQVQRRRDLRELSKWIDAKRKVNERKEND
ncbi:MAG TPA: hypothetical protein VGN07_21125 [Steroidobacteraceae bacterium]|jgi:hypothetical protein